MDSQQNRPQAPNLLLPPAVSGTVTRRAIVQEHAAGLNAAILAAAVGSTDSADAA